MSDVEQPIPPSAPTTLRGRLWYSFKGLPLMKMLKVVGCVCGILSIVLGFWNLFTSLMLPKSIIFGLYNILFGLLMIVCEMRWKRLLKYFKFLTHFIGLGLFYIFVGGLALGSAWYALALGIALIIIGTLYTLLGFCGLRMGHEELPKFMQRQDAVNGSDSANDVNVKTKLTKQSTSQSTSSATASPEPANTYIPPTFNQQQYSKQQKTTTITKSHAPNRQIHETDSVSISINNSGVDNEYAIQSHSFADAPVTTNVVKGSKQQSATTTTTTSPQPLNQPSIQNKYNDYNPFE